MYYFFNEKINNISFFKDESKNNTSQKTRTTPRHTLSYLCVYIFFGITIVIFCCMGFFYHNKSGDYLFFGLRDYYLLFFILNYYILLYILLLIYYLLFIALPFISLSCSLLYLCLYGFFVFCYHVTMLPALLCNFVTLL